MTDARFYHCLCGMCGMLCGMLCGIKLLILKGCAVCAVSAFMRACARVSIIHASIIDALLRIWHTAHTAHTAHALYINNLRHHLYRTHNRTYSTRNMDDGELV